MCKGYAGAKVFSAGTEFPRYATLIDFRRRRFAVTIL